MEKQDEVKGIMELGGQQGQNYLENSTAENDSQLSQLLQKDTEILMGLLPGRVWLNVTDMLLADQCTNDLNNFSDASPFFRDLILSKRVLFLFPKVLKIIGPTLENEERASNEDKSSILTCRLVCKLWTKSVFQYISSSAKPQFLQTPPPQPRDPAMINARYKYFGFMAPQRLHKFLRHFDQSHQSDLTPQRNPFIGTTVAICTDTIRYSQFHLRQQHCDNVLTLLRNYGRFIRVLSMGFQPPVSDLPQDYFWLKQCLELTPNLTHLKVSHTLVNEDGGARSMGRIDTYFGEHAYRTEGTAEYIRRRIFNEMGRLPVPILNEIYAEMVHIIEEGNARIPVGLREEQDFGGDKELAFLAYNLADGHGLAEIREDEEQRYLDENDIDPPSTFMSDNDYWTAIAGHPLPVLKKLKCLKLRRLSARIFNHLIQSNRHITWLHIEPYNWNNRMSRYVDWWTLDFPNLRKLYIQFTGGPVEVMRLRNAHPSFMKLTSLHFDYPFLTRQYMGWVEIFEMLGQNWGSTLTELKIRLPEPRREEDKEDARNALEVGRLALPKLKRLVMWKSGLTEDEKTIRNSQFLRWIRKNLDEFVVLSD